MVLSGPVSPPGGPGDLLPRVWPHAAVAAGAAADALGGSNSGHDLLRRSRPFIAGSAEGKLGMQPLRARSIGFCSSAEVGVAVGVEFRRLREGKLGGSVCIEVSEGALLVDGEGSGSRDALCCSLEDGDRERVTGKRPCPVRWPKWSLPNISSTRLSA
mmetsp:Transcript_2163/g.4947  ORF Transcript_2163/g.4947 Transcript_2163/m.4947 type:complete len:158 (+) Transcript_2163:660-1133(+)